ncbi:MAG TPA: hypothetical protein VL654_09220 [Casimicrobiaceae bacterium]|nr:hypothetical protein [Casimicrobiaceae bacterium]
MNVRDREARGSARAPAVLGAAARRGSLRLPVTTLPQPDETTCGPTCLHAIYAYFGGDEPLPTVIERMWRLEHGGTYAVYLACDALRNGYRARLYTYNLTVFDPTWFTTPRVDVAARLVMQRDAKDERRGQHAIDGYLEFLARGGRLRFANLSQHLIRRILQCRLPILTGLSSTYLYRSVRECPDGTPDDVRGHPVGHFVVIAGWDERQRRVMVVDPYQPNPWGPSHEYWISVDRVVAAILLGIVTHDANLLGVYPPPYPSPLPEGKRE